MHHIIDFTWRNRFSEPPSRGIKTRLRGTQKGSWVLKGIRLSFGLLIWLSGAFASVCVYAQDSSTSISLPELSQTKLPRPETPSQYDFSGYLRFENFAYATSIPSQPHLDQTRSFYGNFRSDRQGDTKFVTDITLGTQVDARNPYFAVHEFYVGREWNRQAGSSINGEESKPQKDTQLSLGRKLEYWSTADTDWNLGLWQPTYSQIDALRPTEQGLTGAFYRLSSGRNEMQFFASPIFIPSMGPDVQEKNGSLISDSRWYRQPSSSFKWNDAVTKIVYSLEIPDLAGLVAKPGAAVRYKYGGGANEPMFVANLARKPMNALLLKYKVSLSTPEVNDQGEAVVTPAVGYHTLRGIDVGYRWNNTLLVVSALQDTPTTSDPEGDWVQQQPEDATVTSAHLSTDISTSSWPLRASFSYLRINGGKIHDVNSNHEDQGALFDQRFQFTNAASMKLEWPFQIRRKKVLSSFKYLREFDQEGSLYSAEASIFPFPQWAVVVGADVLGVDNPKGNLDATFLNRFRANDRYYGGLSYVF